MKAFAIKPLHCATCFLQNELNYSTENHSAANWDNSVIFQLTLKVPITTKVVCFLVCLYASEASMTNSMDPDQTAVCSGSTLFASIFKFVGNAWQLFAADDFSRRHFQMHFS